MQSGVVGSPGPIFVLISFEGPDRYSQAGGLGVRVTELSRTLVEFGFETHLFFIGDPAKPGEERKGGLTLHRWGQWISNYFPGGVYDGEEDKRRDMNASLPPYVVEHVLLPAIRAGRVPIVLLEEWQTAECATLIADELRARGLRDRAVVLWNANNAYSFERIDWPRLAGAATITAVSRYMRSILRARDVNALVIPNGIPERLNQPVSRAQVNGTREAFGGTPFFFKMARWGRDKGWLQALDAMRVLRDRQRPALLLARCGGPAGVGGPLDAEAEARGLRVLPVASEFELRSAVTRAKLSRADVLALRFGVSESLARGLYATAEGVLANSVSEPFGLVGLEAMAAGGVLYTGGTGEDYAVSGQNAVVLETLEPDEIADRAEELREDPVRARRLRLAARRSARNHSWRQTTGRLFMVIEQQAARQGMKLQLRSESPTPSHATPTVSPRLTGYMPARGTEVSAAAG